MMSPLRIAMIALAAGLAAAQAPVEIPDGEVAEHRTADVTWVRGAGAGIFQSFRLSISVDANGTVTSAEVVEGPIFSRGAAAALVRTWRYKPFLRNGKAVPATFTEYVSFLPPERLPSKNVPFPAVRDWASVKIRLTRTRCFGMCPAYTVEIDGKGDVVFRGEYPKEEEHHGHISRAELERLVDVFRQANYFSLAELYRVQTTDLPTYKTSIAIDGRSMSVRDYGGLQAGMPDGVRRVEEAIDEAARTSQWLPRSQ